MDNRFRMGLLHYEQKFHPSSKRRGGCARTISTDEIVYADPTDGEIAVEVSSTYFDYPKAPSRIAAVLPDARIVMVLREPISRALSAYNFRWYGHTSPRTDKALLRAL